MDVDTHGRWESMGVSNRHEKLLEAIKRLHFAPKKNKGQMAEGRKDTGRKKRDGSHKRGVKRWIMMMEKEEGR